MSKIENLDHYSDSELLSFYIKFGSKTKVLKHCDIKGSDGRARARLTKRLGSVCKQKKATYSKEKLLIAIERARCWLDIYRELGISICGHNKKVVLRALKKHDIESPSFDSRRAMRRNKPTYKDDEVFCVDSQVSKGTLKKDL